MHDWSDDVKKAQILYYDELSRQEGYAARVIAPQDEEPFWGVLHRTVLDRIASLLGVDGVHKRMVNVCCGTGGQLQYFSSLGAGLIGADISAGQIRCAALRSKHYGFHADLVVSDAERLPLKAGCCHISLAYEGLHHLPNPHEGIAELARVSREAIVFFEAMDTLTTRLLVHFGVVDKYEPSGLEPYRFTEAELGELLANLGFKHVKFYRYLWHNPSCLTTPLTDSRPGLWLLKLLFVTLNKLFAPLGNGVVVAWK